MKARSIATNSIERPTIASIVLLCLFAALTVVVNARLLAAFDLGFARALQPLHIWLMLPLATATGILVAGQTAILYVLIATPLLWRAGLRLWSLAPFAFLVTTLVEIEMKSTINQPMEPLRQFHRSTFYPFAGTTPVLEGSFPSGHSSRTAFFCTFLAVLLWSRGTLPSRAAAAALIVLIPLVGFTRLYVGDHWLSDVIAGILLGAALALLVAPPVASRLR